MQRVIVVGGGYAGAHVAQALDAAAEVRLVEPKDRFVHNVAAVRAVTDPAWLDRIAIPYDRLLKRGAVIQGRVANIRDGSVRLTDGSVFEADLIVAATGSTYALPFKAGDDGSVDRFLDASRAANRDLARARSVIIVGAGPVGIELAGEIATAHRNKRVTLVSVESSLLPDYPEKLGRALASQLAAMNVEVQLGERVAGLETIDRPRFDDSAGELLVPAFGARPTPPPIPGAELAASGRMIVDAWMRPRGTRRVFVLGDAAAIGAPMTIVAANHQVVWLVKLLKAVLIGRDPMTLAGYKPAAAPGLLVPLGPKAGASVLPVTGHGLVVGRGLTSAIKGRDLFVTSYRRRFGYPPSPPGEQAAPQERARSVAEHV